MLSHPSALPPAPQAPDVASAAVPSSLSCAASDAGGGRPCVRSDELLRGGREIDIAHGDAVYRLRVTALGRLILTK